MPDSQISWHASGRSKPVTPVDTNRALDKSLRLRENDISLATDLKTNVKHLVSKYFPFIPLKLGELQQNYQTFFKA